MRFAKVVKHCAYHDIKCYNYSVRPTLWALDAQRVKTVEITMNSREEYTPENYWGLNIVALQLLNTYKVDAQ